MSIYLFRVLFTACLCGVIWGSWQFQLGLANNARAYKSNPKQKATSNLGATSRSKHPEMCGTGTQCFAPFFATSRTQTDRTCLHKWRSTSQYKEYCFNHGVTASSDNQSTNYAILNLFYLLGWVYPTCMTKLETTKLWMVYESQWPWQNGDYDDRDED